MRTYIYSDCLKLGPGSILFILLGVYNINIVIFIQNPPPPPPTKHPLP